MPPMDSTSVSARSARLSPYWHTRPEHPGEAGTVREINLSAFGTAEEADLVDALRTDPEAWLPQLAYLALRPAGGAAASRAGGPADAGSPRERDRPASPTPLTEKGSSPSSGEDALGGAPESPAPAPPTTPAQGYAAPANAHASHEQCHSAYEQPHRTGNSGTGPQPDPDAAALHATPGSAPETDQLAVGYALLTRCRIGGTPALALGPCAVRPPYQGRGAGSAAVRSVLAEARAAGERAVVVLGHPAYYPRFGFTPCVRHGIEPPAGQEWPHDAFLALSLDGGPLPRGTVRYARAFGL